MCHNENFVERIIDMEYDWSDFENPKPRGQGVKRTFGNIDLYDN